MENSVYFDPISSDSSFGTLYYFESDKYIPIIRIPGQRGDPGDDGTNGTVVNGKDVLPPSFADIVNNTGPEVIINSGILKPVFLGTILDKNVGSNWAITTINGLTQVVINRKTKYEIAYSIIVKMKKNQFNASPTIINADVGVRKVGTFVTFTSIPESDTSITYTYYLVDGSKDTTQITKTFITSFTEDSEVVLRVSSNNDASIIDSNSGASVYGPTTVSCISFRSIDE